MRHQTLLPPPPRIPLKPRRGRSPGRAGPAYPPRRARVSPASLRGRPRAGEEPPLLPPPAEGERAERGEHPGAGSAAPRTGSGAGRGAASRTRRGGRGGARARYSPTAAPPPPVRWFHPLPPARHRMERAIRGGPRRGEGRYHFQQKKKKRGGRREIDGCAHHSHLGANHPPFATRRAGNAAVLPGGGVKKESAPTPTPMSQHWYGPLGSPA